MKKIKIVFERFREDGERIRKIEGLPKSYIKELENED